MVFDWAKMYEAVSGENEIYTEFFEADSTHLFISGLVLSNINDFDPGTGTYMLEAPYDRSFHVSKFDLDGNHNWSIIFGSTNAGSPSSKTEIRDMKLDHNGNVYVTGTFLDSLYYETAGGLESITSNGSTDIFYGKLDTNGYWLWMKSYGNIYPDGAGGISIAQNGDIYLSGYYADSVAFIPTSAPNYAPYYELFTLKFNAQDQEQWVYSTDNPATTPVFNVNSMVLDNDNGIYIGGSYFDYNGDSVNFQSEGNTELLANSNYDGFVLKLNTEGNFEWAKSYSTGSDDYVDQLAFNSANNSLIISGRAGDDTLDFDPSTTADSLNFQSGFFGNYLLCLTSEGQYKWLDLLFANSSGPISRNMHITTDSQGNIHGLGTFATQIDADPGSGTVYYEPSAGGASYSSYSLKLDSMGNYLWSYQYKTTYNSDLSYGIGKDPFDNIYIGLFDGTGINPETLSLGNIDLLHEKTARHFAKLRACEAESVTQVNDTTLMGIYLNVNYQWLDCDDDYSVIPGETERTFTPTISGNYALSTTSYGCETNISDCYAINLNSLGIKDSPLSDAITVYPNPTLNNITVKLPESEHTATCSVYNVYGQTVFSQNFEGVSSFKIKLPDNAGIYIAEIKLDNNQRVVKKLVKE